MLRIKRRQGNNKKFQQYEELLNNKVQCTTRGDETKELQSYKAPYKKTKKATKGNFVTQYEATTRGGPYEEQIMIPYQTDQYLNTNEYTQRGDYMPTPYDSSEMIQTIRNYHQDSIVPRKMRKKHMLMEQQQQQIQCFSNKRNKKRKSTRKADILMEEMAKKIQNLENEKKLIIFQLTQTKHQCQTWKQRAINCQSRLNQFVKSIAKRMNYNPQRVRAEFFEQEYDFDADNPYQYAEREILQDSQGGQQARQFEQGEESKNKILQFCRFYGLKGRRLVDKEDNNNEYINDKSAEQKPKTFKISVVLFQESQEDQQSLPKVEQIIGQKEQIDYSAQNQGYIDEKKHDEDDQEKQYEGQQATIKLLSSHNDPYDQYLHINQQQSYNNTLSNDIYTQQPIFLKSNSVISSNSEIFWNQEYQRQSVRSNGQYQDDNSSFYSPHLLTMRDQSYLNSHQNSVVYIDNQQNQNPSYFIGNSSPQMPYDSSIVSHQINNHFIAYDNNNFNANQVVSSMGYLNREHSQIESAIVSRLNEGSEIQVNDELASNCGRQSGIISVGSDVMTHHSRLEEGFEQEQLVQDRRRGIGRNIDGEDDDDDDYDDSKSDFSSLMTRYQRN